MNNPSTLIFLGLAVVWAIVLLPEAIKKLSKVRRSDSIRSFNHQLSVLDRSGAARRGSTRSLGRSVGGANVIDIRDRRKSVGQAPEAARTSVAVPATVKRRRQEVTATLAAVAVLTFLCVIAFGTAFLIVHLIADALLVGYLFLVSQANKNAVARNSSPLLAPYQYQGSSVARLDSNGLRQLPPAANQRSRRSI